MQGFRIGENVNIGGGIYKVIGNAGRHLTVRGNAIPGDRNRVIKVKDKAFQIIRSAEGNTLLRAAPINSIERAQDLEERVIKEGTCRVKPALEIRTSDTDHFI